ncbi:MAG: TonB-dependent receptor [Pseudohongiellaceae bacterium]
MKKPQSTTPYGVYANLFRSGSIRARNVIPISFVTSTFFWPIFLFAAENADPAIEQIIVVDSHIDNVDFHSSQVQVLTSEDLRSTGALSLGDTLQEIAAVGSSMNSTGYYGPGNGASSLNLRSLGENRNLILVNGHRWVNGANKAGLDFVDLNTIPQAIVRNVEVLQEGASAVYGSDAITGVININTYAGFDGIRINTSYGESSRGDRESERLDLLWGDTLGASNWMLGLSHVDEQPVYTQDRKISALPLNGLTQKTGEGIFRENSLGPVLGVNAITRDPGSNGDVIANWRAVNSDTDQTNAFYNNYMMAPSRRLAAYVQNRTPLGSSLVLTFDALYNRRDSHHLLSSASPAPLIRGSRGFAIPANPAVNPFDVEFSGSDFRLDNFFEDLGQRVKAQDVETLRWSTGLEGETDGGWQWELFASWSQNEAITTNTNDVDLDKLALGMLACDTSGISQDISDLETGCVPVNLFNPLTPAMQDYIRYTAYEFNSIEQHNVAFNLSGDLLELPAGVLSFASGYEYRKLEAYDEREPYGSQAPRVNTYRTLSIGPRAASEGEIDVNEVYLELYLPVLRDAPWVDELAFSAATRYSDYSTFGSTTNNKLAMSFFPVEDILIRTSWAEGFRAPSIMELYAGSRESISPLSDPCENQSANYPGCAGVPDGYQAPAFTLIDTGGNVDLKPETSINKSIGISYQPAGTLGLDLSLDWQQIDIENTISTYGEQDILDLCALRNELCNLIDRAGSGEIIALSNVPVNLNQTSVELVDLGIGYRFPLAGGMFDVKLTTTRLFSIEENLLLPSGETYTEELVGIAKTESSFPKWRALLKAYYSKNDWQLALTSRFIGDTEEILQGQPRHISSVVYHSVQGDYRFNSQLSLKIGVDNIGDKKPPISYINQNINFDPETYNGLGRYYYAGLTLEFN